MLKKGDPLWIISFNNDITKVYFLKNTEHHGEEAYRISLKPIDESREQYTTKITKSEKIYESEDKAKQYLIKKQEESINSIIKDLDTSIKKRKENMKKDEDRIIKYEKDKREQQEKLRRLISED